MLRRLLVLGVLLGGLGANAAPPRLVVQITVDGLPTETVLQFADRVRPGGMGRFFREGAVFTGAEYPYLTTFTAVGHASLFTGALPSEHGLIGNEWLDSVTGKEVYCVEDPASVILDFPTKEHEGTSPANLESTTIGDELVRASGGRSRVFSISGKDRGAILPGGKLGKAIWYSKTAGTFVTSSYYYPSTPEWLTAWRQQHSMKQFQGSTWQLLRKPEEYRRVAQDDRASEKGLGTTFPHDLGAIDEAKYADGIRWTPFLDELTITLAQEIVERQQLGRGETPDLLCISLSAMDLVSHTYGPDSLEAEDTYYRLDALLEKFFTFLDSAVGMEHTLIALSADHGFGRSPEQIKSEGLPSTRVTAAQLGELLEKLRADLQQQFGLDPKVVQGYRVPFVYLDRAVIAAAGKPLDEVQRFAADRVAQWPGVAWTAPRSALLSGQLPHSKFHDRATVSLSTTRGGDVLLVLKPWSLIETPETAYPSSHGTPYAYDTRVPVLFVGNGVKAQRVDRPVSPLDIAPTLATRLDITPPPATSGVPMLEVTGGGK